MGNRFSKYYTNDMTVRQVDHRYFQLLDAIGKDSPEVKELNEAHMAAWDAAIEREDEIVKKIQSTAPEGITYVVCYDA